MYKQKFFNSIRKTLFSSLSQSQVDGINNILDLGERKDTPLNHLAYILSTSYWETGKKMQPVREIGKGRGRKYGIPAGPYGKVYYGRGDVQLTWYDNYVKLGKLVGVDLARNPDLALDPKISKKILFAGMEQGLFTGKRLQDFIDTIDEPDKEDGQEFEGARKIINGTDKKKQIANIALLFEKALKESDYGEEMQVEEEKVVVQKVEKIDTGGIWIIFVILLILSVLGILGSN